uniref:CRISPR locus-related DNA-binding protein n=1 Tax=Ignisphaera aggregans TaxID=334771 RepID=A0A7C4H256_9CREN
MKRIVVASVGFNWSRTLRGIYGIGLYPNDIIILVNSKPEKEDAVNAMNIIKGRLSEVGVKALELWLNHIDPFELNVARVRSLIERYAPCSVVILIAGGFRWITTVLIFSATVLNTIGNLVRDRIIVEKIRIEIEEELEGIDITDNKPLYIEIHHIPKLINLTIEDYEILKIIGQNQDINKKSIIKIKDIANQSGKPRTTIIRKLVKLEKIGLITREVQGRYYTYKLTDIGKMLAIST